MSMAEMTEDPAKAALFRLLAIRIAMLAHPMSQVRPGTIHRIATGEVESITESCLYHYIDGMRLTHSLRLFEIARQINAGVFQGEGRVHKVSVLEILPKIPADVAYFDPPYPGVMSYEREYKIIDEILEGTSRPTSPFTKKDGASLLDTLFERAAHIPVWILSLGNAVVSIEELEARMAKYGRQTKAIALKYQHLPAVATAEKKRTNREFLVIGWDPNATIVRAFSAGGFVRNNKIGRELNGSLSGVHTDTNSGSSEGSAPQSLPVDAVQESHPSPPEVTSNGRSPITKDQFGINRPDSILVESGVDVKHKRGRGALGSHDPNVH
jgi:hypothetical protein